MKSWILIFILGTILGLTGAANGQQSDNWKLVWSDEFDYKGLPDSSKWNYDTRGNEYGWGNNEKQWYNVATIKNTEVSNGTLKIRAFKEPTGNKEYSSGRLTTLNKGDWKYCKVEVRAKLPEGRGTWPAIWMLSTHNGYGGWPESGEIDIMEHVGHYPDTVFATAHTGDFNHMKRTEVGKKIHLPTATSQFHVYGLEWDEHEFRCYVDGRHYFTYKNNGQGTGAWPFDKPFYLILNLAIGGGLGGKMGIDDSLFPHIMEVDYVRVYERDDPVQRPAAQTEVAPVTGSIERSTIGLMKRWVVQEGVLSIHTKNFTSQKGWEQKNSYSGDGLMLLKSERVDNMAKFAVKFDSPGEYKLYLLGHRQRNSPVKENQVKISLVSNQNTILSETLIQMPANNAPVWMQRTSDGNISTLKVPSVGDYFIEMQAKSSHRLFVEKILLSAGTYVPKGSGPQETLPDTRVHLGGFDSLVVLPPHWAFGVIYGGYTNQQESEDVVQKIIDSDFPIDAYWIDSWIWNYTEMGRGPRGYISFREDTLAYPAIDEMWNKFQSQKVKGGIWIWDCIFREGNEKVYDDFRARKFFSNSFITNDKWHNRTGHTITGNIDFENPNAVAYWQQQLKPLFDKGLDFLKLDRSSAIPFTKAAFEATQRLGKETNGRGFVLAHLHSLNNPEHKRYPTKWTGDAKIAWSQPDYPDNSVYAMGGYKDNVAMVADPKRTTYEVGFLAHDAGGYDFFGERKIDEELYVRWMQFASMNTIMTLFSQHTNPTKNHPYAFPDSIQQIVRKYMHLRMQLFPYIYTYALRTRLDGEKMVQGDRKHEDQYLFGKEILVAPIVEKGATKRKVYFPEGTWFDFETGESYSGQREYLVEAPLSKLPFFIRKGAIVPMRDYARAIELGNNNRLTLLIYPDAKSSFTILEDDGNSNEYLDGKIGITPIHVKKDNKQTNIEIGAMQGAFTNQPNSRVWLLKVHQVETKPLKVTNNGKVVNGTYDAENKIFSFSLNGSVQKTQRIVITEK